MKFKKFSWPKVEYSTQQEAQTLIAVIVLIAILVVIIIGCVVFPKTFGVVIVVIAVTSLLYTAFGPIKKD